MIGKRKVIQKHTSVEKKTLPVFKLASFASPNIKVTDNRLLAFYEKHSSFPEQFRPLIWRFLLKLPENSEIFTDLAQRGVHPSYEDLNSRFPLKSDRDFKRLQLLCSMMANWSPIFAEVSYLPQFMFPFLIVFDQNELAAFETVITISMWWGFSWNTLFPNPPLHITSAIDKILALHDRVLYDHLIKLEVSPGLLGWRLLYTLFTEILSKDNWLTLMDFIFLNFSRPELMVIIPVAVLRAGRIAITHADDESHIMTFLCNQQYLNGREIVRLTINMCESTPADLFTAAISGMKEGLRNNPPPLVSQLASASRADYSKKHSDILTKKTNKPMPADDKENQSSDTSASNATSAIESTMIGVSMPSTTDISKKQLKTEHRKSMHGLTDEAMTSMAQYAGQAVFPLPKGGYPAYSGYPKTIVDWEIKKRESIIAIHREMHGHSELLAQLRDRVSKAEEKHMKWMTDKNAEHEVKYGKERELMTLEREEMLKLYAMEQDVTRQRIESLAALERIASDEAALSTRLEHEQEAHTRQTAKHKKETAEVKHKIGQHREIDDEADHRIIQAMQELPSKPSLEDSYCDEMNATAAITATNDVYYTTTAAYASKEQRDVEYDSNIKVKRTQPASNVNPFYYSASAATATAASTTAAISHPVTHKQKPPTRTVHTRKPFFVGITAASEEEEENQPVESASDTAVIDSAFYGATTAAVAPVSLAVSQQHWVSSESSSTQPSTSVEMKTKEESYAHEAVQTDMDFDSLLRSPLHTYGTTTAAASASTSTDVVTAAVSSPIRGVMRTATRETSVQTTPPYTTTTTAATGMSAEEMTYLTAATANSISNSSSASSSSGIDNTTFSPFKTRFSYQREQAAEAGDSSALTRPPTTHQRQQQQYKQQQYSYQPALVTNVNNEHVYKGEGKGASQYDREVVTRERQQQQLQQPEQAHEHEFDMATHLQMLESAFGDLNRKVQTTTAAGGGSKLTATFTTAADSQYVRDEQQLRYGHHTAAGGGGRGGGNVMSRLKAATALPAASRTFRSTVPEPTLLGSGPLSQSSSRLHSHTTAARAEAIDKRTAVTKPYTPAYYPPRAQSVSAASESLRRRRSYTAPVPRTRKSQAMSEAIAHTESSVLNLSRSLSTKPLSWHSAYAGAVGTAESDVRRNQPLRSSTRPYTTTTTDNDDGFLPVYSSRDYIAATSQQLSSSSSSSSTSFSEQSRRSLERKKKLETFSESMAHMTASLDATVQQAVAAAADIVSGARTHARAGSRIDVSSGQAEARAQMKYDKLYQQQQQQRSVEKEEA